MLSVKEGTERSNESKRLRSALISQDRLINKVRLFHFKIDLSQSLFKMSPESNFSPEHLEKHFGLQVLEFTTSKLKKPGDLQDCFQ